MIDSLKHYFKYKFYIRKWRKKNWNNDTIPMSIYNLERVNIGKRTYGSINLIDWNNDVNVKLEIGSYCSISDNVRFVLGGGHQINSISTFPFKNKYLKIENEATSKGSIVVGNDVWIGTNCIILSGVSIGNGAIIGAGTVVTKNVEAYTIVAGNPARVIKKRFSDEIIKVLKNINLLEIFEKFNISNSDLFYSELTLEKLNQLLKL